MIINDAVNKKKEIINLAEFKILSIFMCSTTAKDKIAESIEANDFITKKHKTIFSAILDLYRSNKKVDPLILIDILHKKKLLNEAGGENYIQKIYAEYIGDTFYTNYLKLITEYSKRIKLESLASFIGINAKNEEIDPDEILVNVENKISELFNNSSKKNDFEHFHKLSNSLYEKLDKLSRSNETLTGIATGYHELDRLTDGFHEGELVILAARPSMGKTALALNFATKIFLSDIQANKNKNPLGIVFFSLEMPNIQLVSRMHSMIGEIDLQKTNTGKNLTQSDWEKMVRIRNLTKKTEIYFNDSSSITISKIEIKLKRLCKEKPHIKIVIIDYLQLISTNNFKTGSSRQQEVSKISRNLKIIARELKITIICLSQLSRAVESREDKRPLMSDLRDSGSIEQDADLVMLLYRQSYYDSIKQNNKNPNRTFDNNQTTNSVGDLTELILVKNRNGPVGKVLLQFVKEFGKFTRTKI